MLSDTMKFGLPVLILALNVAAPHWAHSKLTEAFKWRQVDFQFPNDNVRNALIQSKRYIQANNSMLGLEVWNNKLFLTVPRWYAGVFSTLNYVNLDSATKSPPLIPYPDYTSNDIHSGNPDDKIISASRIFVDTCHRLWVPDNGQEGISLSTPTVLGSHKLLIYDLNTNRLIRKVMIGKEVKRELSMFYEVVADITNKDCNKAFAYVSDTIGYGMLVYSWETNTLRRISNSYFYFEPQSSAFNNIQLNGGLMGLALSGVNRDGYKTLYFHGFISSYEYNVSTRVIKDPNLSRDFTNFHLKGSRGVDGQSTTQRLDEKSGVLFYTQVKRNGIGCWNSKLYPNEYTTATTGMAAVDRRRITFPNAITLDSHRHVWVLSNNLLAFGSSLNPREYNYRVFNASVERLIEDTVCDGVVDGEMAQIWS